MFTLLLTIAVFIAAASVLGALSADSPTNFLTGELASYPVLGNTTIYEGAMVGLQTSSGYVRPLASGDVFVGHALARVENNPGANGAKTVIVRRGRYVAKCTLTSVAITDTDKPVFASADDTLTLTQSTNVLVGRIAGYVGTNTCYVEFNTSPGAVAHIANPSGGSTVDTECRTAVNSILIALESQGITRNA